MTNLPTKCDECGTGTLQPRVWEADIKHGDQTLHVEALECHVCDSCAADPVFPDQARRNSARFADARRAADGLLTGVQIRAARDQLGLSQADAAVLFGGGANAFSKYERGEVMQSVAMDRLIRLVACCPLLTNQLRVYAGQKVASLVDWSSQNSTFLTIATNDTSFHSRSLGGEAMVLNHSAWASNRETA